MKLLLTEIERFRKYLQNYVFTQSGSNWDVQTNNWNDYQRLKSAIYSQSDNYNFDCGFLDSGHSTLIAVKQG